jgi:AhpD family alkylhydroperoxidase
LAGDPPRFYKDTFPVHALKAALEANEALTGPDAKLQAKTRELIALGVAAQIPCAYCVYVHNMKARAQGATEAEIREAVATAAHVRHWSTVLNGMAYDLSEFKAEVDRLMASN